MQQQKKEKKEKNIHTQNVSLPVWKIISTGSHFTASIMKTFINGNIKLFGMFVVYELVPNLYMADLLYTVPYDLWQVHIYR